MYELDEDLKPVKHYYLASEEQVWKTYCEQLTMMCLEGPPHILSTESRLLWSSPKKNRPNILKYTYCAQNYAKWQHSCRVNSFPAKIACCHDVTFSKVATFLAMPFSLKNARQN